MNEDNLWESGSDSSTHSDYDNYRDSDEDTVASTMLAPFLDAEPRSKKKGNGKVPAPKKKNSGGSKTPQQQQPSAPEKVFTDKRQQEDMPIEIVEELVPKAFISVMEGHFAKLYTKIDNLKTEVSTPKTTVGSLVEENKKMGEVRGNAPDPELQPPATPHTATKDLTIRPRPVLPALPKRVGTPLAREVSTQNWAKQVENDNATPMNIDELDAEPGRPGKALRLTSPPPSLMHSRHAGASATVVRRVDGRGEKD